MNHPHSAPRVRSILSAAILLALSNTVNAQEASDEPTIVVSAARSAQVVTDALPHTTLIDRATIEQSPAADVVGLLKMQSGLSITQSGTSGSLSGVRIRGGETSHTLILLDGVPMNSLSAGSHASLEQIPLSSIERIEIVRGNVSALYGSQAVGGVIQIFTRKPNGNDATIRVAGGNRGQRQVSVQVRGGNEVVQATVGISHDEVRAVSALNADDIAKVNPFHSVNPDKDDYKNDSANAHIRYRPNANNEFGLRFLESRGENNNDNQYAVNNAGIQYNKTRVQNITLYANNQLTANWKSNLRLSQFTDRAYDRYDEAVSYPDFYDSGELHYQTRTRELAWQNNIYSTVGEFVVGISRKQQKLSSDAVYAQTQRTTDSAWLGYNLDQARHHLQLNARTDKLSNVGRENTGSINYGFDVSDKVKLFAGYSNGYAAPDFAQLYYPGYMGCPNDTWGCAKNEKVLIPTSNPNLKPEHANYAQVSVQYDHGDYGVRATYFDTRYRDKIALQSSFPKIPININRARAQGVEWHGWYNANGWNVNSSLTYQEVTNRATDEHLLRQPRILASLGLGKSWGKWHGQLDWQLQGSSVDEANYKKVKVAGYGVVNAALTYAPMSNVKLGLSVGNLFNRHYQTVYGYNSMPRNVLLSLQYQPKW